MPIPRIDTGETAKPLKDWEEREFEKRSEELHRMTDNQLLKEILTKSDKKCNALIERQNTLIEDLTTTVKDLKKSNESLRLNLHYIVTGTTSQMQETLESERKFKTEISEAVKRAITTSASEVKENALKQVDETVSEVKRELKETQKEIERQRDDMKFQHGFRKFLFWATPILLLAQTIAIIITAL